LERISSILPTGTKLEDVNYLVASLVSMIVQHYCQPVWLWLTSH